MKPLLRKYCLDFHTHPPPVPLCVIRFGLGNKINRHSLHLIVTKQVHGSRLPKLNLWKIALRDKTSFRIEFVSDQKVLVRANTDVLVCNFIKNSIWPRTRLSVYFGSTGSGGGWSLSKVGNDFCLQEMNPKFQNTSTVNGECHSYSAEELAL